MKSFIIRLRNKILTKKAGATYCNGFVFFLTVSAYFSCRTAMAAPGGSGVEELLVNASDYLSARLIPAASGVGILSGGAMAGLGNPRGWEVVKWSIGGAVCSAGVNTLQHVFFQ